MLLELPALQSTTGNPRPGNIARLVRCVHIWYDARAPKGDPMEDHINDAVRELARIAASREVPPNTCAPNECVRVPITHGATMYANKNDRLGIDFNVERLAFAGLQTMDPRVVRIPPGKNNELHKHAHETLFVILDGSGEVLVGDTRLPVAKGSVAFVPRWLFHQTLNTGTTELVVLAITDFGFTSAVLGDYDRRTRLKEGGTDAEQGGKS